MDTETGVSIHIVKEILVRWARSQVHYGNAVLREITHWSNR